MQHPQAAYTGPTPATGYVGYVNVQKTDDGGVRFTVRSEGEAPVTAAYVIDQDNAIKLLSLALGMLSAGEVVPPLNDVQVKHLVDRFLGWRLPESFRPDCGIHFDADAAKKLNPRNHRYEPSGTNLFDATQADAMVRHMLEGMPPSERDDTLDKRLRRIATAPTADGNTAPGILD